MLNQARFWWRYIFTLIKPIFRAVLVVSMVHKLEHLHNTNLFRKATPAPPPERYVA